MAQTNATEEPTKCVGEPTKIIYANGILGVKKNSNRIARLMLAEVKEKMRNDLIITYANGASKYGWGYCHDLYVDIQWNPSNGAIWDIYQAWRQLKGQVPVEFMKTLSHYWPWPVELESKVIEISSKYPTIPILNNDLWKYANRYQSEQHAVGPRGQLYPWRNIIVSHSQANFFTNKMFQKYFGGSGVNSEVRLISVANPDDRVMDRGPYVTFYNDKVIGAVAGFVTTYNIINDPDLPLPMSPNTQGNSSNVPIGTKYDGTNHEFLVSYFGENTGSQSKIMQLIIDKIKTVPFEIEDPDDPDGTGTRIQLAPAAFNPSTGEQEACPVVATGFIYNISGYECTNTGIYGSWHCQPIGPTCDLN